MLMMNTCSARGAARVFSAKAAKQMNATARHSNANLRNNTPLFYHMNKQGQGELCYNPWIE
jgi:hypothetical protein